MLFWKNSLYMWACWNLDFILPSSNYHLDYIIKNKKQMVNEKNLQNLKLKQDLKCFHLQFITSDKGSKGMAGNIVPQVFSLTHLGLVQRRLCDVLFGRWSPPQVLYPWKKIRNRRSRPRSAAPPIHVQKRERHQLVIVGPFFDGKLHLEKLLSLFITCDVIFLFRYMHDACEIICARGEKHVK